MAAIITVHSFRGGTGKSTITSNIASTLASLGNTVLIVDTDLKSPGIHAMFGLDEDSFTHTFNDYLTGSCKIKEVVYDVSDDVKIRNGKLLLTPSSIEYGEIANTLLSKYSYKLLKKAFEGLIEHFELDYLIVDTHPGLNEETLLSAEMSSVFLIIARPDNQDYQGVKVSTDIAKKLGADARIVLNKAHKKVKTRELARQVQNIFEVPVIATIPFFPDVMESESRHIFSREHPKHLFSKEIKKLVAEIAVKK